MTAFKRLTVPQVRRAYAKTGLTPKIGSFKGTGCACAVGVIAIANGIDMDDTTNMMDGICALGYSRNYLWAVTRGFDGRGTLESDDAEARVGYMDGRRIRRCLLGKPGVKL